MIEVASITKFISVTDLTNYRKYLQLAIYLQFINIIACARSSLKSSFVRNPLKNKQNYEFTGYN